MKNRLAKYYNPTFHGGITSPIFSGKASFMPLAGIDSIVENFLRGFGQSYYDPLQELVKRTEEGLEMALTLPGFSQEEIDIQVKNSALYVEANKEDSGYRRAWSLPNDVEVDNISASLQQGILKIIIPLKKPDIKKIDIQVE